MNRSTKQRVPRTVFWAFGRGSSKDVLMFPPWWWSRWRGLNMWPCSDFCKTATGFRVCAKDFPEEILHATGKLFTSVIWCWFRSKLHRTSGAQRGLLAEHNNLVELTLWQSPGACFDEIQVLIGVTYRNKCRLHQCSSTYILQSGEMTNILTFPYTQKLGVGRQFWMIIAKQCKHESRKNLAKQLS